MRDNRTDDTIFIFYMAHTPTHTEESAHQRNSSEKSNIFAKKSEMEQQIRHIHQM